MIEIMQIEYAFLADAAAAPEGKLYVLGGGFDEIFAENFPAVHPTMTLVVKARLGPTECDRRHEMEVDLWDEDGKSIANFSTHFERPRHPTSPTRDVFVQTVANLVGLPFPHAGTYTFRISIDGAELKVLNLGLSQRPPEALPSPGKS